MALPRPTFIDLADSRAASSLSIRWTPGEDSPRVQHNDGDVPPALSPLDAFAAHSRRLARELEETRKAGERRMSRLPPQHVTKSLSEHKDNRPSVFRQLSGESDIVPALPHIPRQDSGNNPEINEHKDRPKSSYPRFSGLLNAADNDAEESFVTPRESAGQQAGYFDAPRSESPTALERRAQTASPPKASTSTQQPLSPSHPDFAFTLAPPNAVFARKPYIESSEDEYTSSNAGSMFSQARKLSSSSGMSLPRSPASPYFQTHDRPPSASSNHSMSTPGNRKSRSHMNFSRPMSSASLTNLMEHTSLSPARQDSARSQDSRGSSNLPELPTPTDSFDEKRSIQSDGFVNDATNYTHATYTLPRGINPERTSALFRGLGGPEFVWQEPMFPGTPPLEGRPSLDLPVPSPNALSRPSKEMPAERNKFSFEFGQEPPRPTAHEDRRPSSSKENQKSSFSPTTKSVRLSTSHAATKTPFVAPPIPPTPVDQVAYSDSRSNSTIRPTTARSHSDYQALSADEHVTKAIDLHQNGDLKESTYHLRIAARQNHPTGMLLYALACRHGWGMRPNPSEGVKWLRKAVDMAQLEVAEDEDPTSERPKPDQGEKKTHRAQFALGIYELGQCHLNGWGMEVDKALALRCFEIAGNWGDIDALSEAGFCYANGIGCKKDLKNAAKWYREAEKKGVNMVGNSW